jgi:hypothetical protein
LKVPEAAAILGSTISSVTAATAVGAGAFETRVNGDQRRFE